MKENYLLVKMRLLQLPVLRGEWFAPVVIKVTASRCLDRRRFQTAGIPVKNVGSLEPRFKNVKLPRVIRNDTLALGKLSGMVKTLNIIQAIRSQAPKGFILWRRFNDCMETGLTL